jgi:hypothetical protein
VYTESIDPVFKFLHKPSFEKIIQTATNSQALSLSHEALMFGIYFVAIISMPAPKVERMFLDSREHLLCRYRSGLERALGQAGLLSTQELSTLQALVLLIIGIRRDEDSRTLWTLVGVAIRLAIGMGLQHDGTKFKLAPFEVEMRRRLVGKPFLQETSYKPFATPIPETSKCR